MIKVLVVDKYEFIGEGTKHLLESEQGISVHFIKCSTQVVQHVKEETYDVYIFDLSMPKKNGLELTTEILKVHQNAKVLIFTAHNLFAHFNYLIKSGVAGFISKLSSKKQLIRAVQCAVEGEAIVPMDLLAQLRRTEYGVVTKDGREITLSQVKENILIKISLGKSNEEIAEELFMSRRNVEHHLTEIYKKLHVKSRIDAIILAWELELIPVVTI